MIAADVFLLNALAGSVATLLYGYLGSSVFSYTRIWPFEPATMNPLV